MSTSSAITTFRLFDRETRVPEIENLVIGYLDPPGMRSLMQTCQIAKSKLRDRCLRDSLQSVLFGSAKWLQCFQIEIEDCCDARRLPIETASEILRARKDAGGAVPFVLPKRLTLRILSDKTRLSPLSVHITPGLEWAGIMDRPVDRTSVVLIGVDPVEGSDGKNYEEQCNIVKALPVKHEVPSLVELVTSTLATHYVKGKLLHLDRFARSSEVRVSRLYQIGTGELLEFMHPIGVQVFPQGALPGVGNAHLWVEDLSNNALDSLGKTYDMMALQRF